MLKREVGPWAIASAVVVLALILGFLGWRLFGPSSRPLSAAEQQRTDTQVEQQYQQYYRTTPTQGR